MREISLSDNDIKKLTVYDTSGCYTDPDINHDYESGLNKLRKIGLSIELVFINQINKI